MWDFDQIAKCTGSTGERASVCPAFNKPVSNGTRVSCAWPAAPAAAPAGCAIPLAVYAPPDAGPKLNHQDTSQHAGDDFRHGAMDELSHAMFDLFGTTKSIFNKPTRLTMLKMIAESQQMAERKPRWVLTGGGIWRVAWGYVLLAVSTADVCRCGLSLAFGQAPYYALDLYVMQTVFLLDMLLKCTTAYHKGGGVLEMRPHAIACNYLRGFFLCDLVGVLPLELWLTPCWPDQADAAACFRARFWMPNWQWLHLLRWMQHWWSCDSWRSITATSNDGPLQIVKYLFLVFMVGHLFCCTFYWASFQAANDGTVLMPVVDYRRLRTLPWTNVSVAVSAHNALDPFNLLMVDSTGELLTPRDEADASNLANLAFWQLYAFWYFAGFACLLGDAFGAKTTAARVLAVLVLLVGNVLFALVFAEMLLCVERFTRSRSIYSARMNAINETMRYKGLPAKFQRRVEAYYEYLWLVDGAAANDADKGHPMKWIDELPAALRVDINLARHEATLRSCPLFDACEPATLLMVAQQLSPKIYMKGEEIVKEGYVGFSMYFITSGVVRVVKSLGQRDEKEIGTLRAGDFFGERALTAAGGTERGATVASISLLRVEKLTRDALEAVATHFPSLLAKITQVANERRRELGEELRLVSGIATQGVLARSLHDNLARGVARRGGRHTGRQRKATVLPSHLPDVRAPKRSCASKSPAASHRGGLVASGAPAGAKKLSQVKSAQALAFEEADSADSTARPLWTAPGKARGPRAVEPDSRPPGGDAISPALQATLAQILEQQAALAKQVAMVQQKLDSFG